MNSGLSKEAAERARLASGALVGMSNVNTNATMGDVQRMIAAVLRALVEEETPKEEPKLSCCPTCGIAYTEHTKNCFEEKPKEVCGVSHRDKDLAYFFCRLPKGHEGWHSCENREWKPEEPQPWCKPGDVVKLVLDDCCCLRGIYGVHSGQEVVVASVRDFNTAQLSGDRGYMVCPKCAKVVGEVKWREEKK
jgi:hypothetical protein